MDVTSLMRRAAQAYANDVAVCDGARSLTFGAAWERACRLANYLRGLGLRTGERVAVLEDNCLESADSFLGIAIANLVRVPLYARNAPEGHYQMLSLTDCRAAIVSAAFASDLSVLRSRLPNLEHLIVRDESYEALLAAQSDADPMIEVSPDDYYIIRHTGGTTGKPKGVAFTHWSWLATARNWFYPLPKVDRGDACLHIAPISHMSGYWFTPIWLQGGRNVLVSGFDPDNTVDLMERERIAYLIVVPTILAAISEKAAERPRDWSALKCLTVGAAPVSDSTALKAREIFGDVLYQAYGQTEAVPVACMTSREWFATVEGSNPLRACGRVTTFANVEIRDEDNRPVEFGQPGQIAVKIDGQMEGYWNDPEATADRLRDGWVLTGDIGVLDRNGYLYLMDRADDLIVSGGFNIWPLELENVIDSHLAVQEVAVVGIPHPKWGETPLAVIVLKGGATATAEEIQRLCAERLGSYKKPSRVEFIEGPLPRTVVGKLRRKVLREPYWAGHERRIGGS